MKRVCVILIFAIIPVVSFAQDNFTKLISSVQSSTKNMYYAYSAAYPHFRSVINCIVIPYYTSESEVVVYHDHGSDYVASIDEYAQVLFYQYQTYMEDNFEYASTVLNVYLNQYLFNAFGLDSDKSKSSAFGSIYDVSDSLVTQVFSILLNDMTCKTLYHMKYN